MHDHRRSTRRSQLAPAFTLVELLVVIGIIGLLIGLLLPALGKVIQRSKSTSTLGTMQEFAKACDAYFQEFGEYPAAIPDENLYAGLNGDGDLPAITAAENALLALMGGSRVPADPDYANFGGVDLNFPAVGSAPAFSIRVNVARMGEGPFKNGRKYDAFYAPKGREFGLAQGQLPSSANLAIPDLLDAWGAPIAFVKQQRTIGPLVPRQANATSAPRGQFERSGFLAYSGSTELGEASLDQTDATKGSVLNTTSAGGQSAAIARNLTFGQLIRHAALNAQTATTTSDAERIWAGTARGKYFMFSPGPDGIYFSRDQVRTSTGAPLSDIVNTALNANPDGPKVVERYDDVVLSGGS
ncbi:MAG: hypothetical protein RI990_1311 [Planctomycetota bacterium]|jgi:type II secretory pathway pseudopilin PulG